jgi:RNA polymerase sigma-70 factor (ECF subfamily)
MRAGSLNIDNLLSGDAKSQDMLYKYFAPKMYGICLRFAGNQMEADDILQEGFIKVFTKLKFFRNEGSLEGWIRRTIINTAINSYRKNQRQGYLGNIEDYEVADARTESIYDKISREELLNLVQSLPKGYRTVFNLNVIEGYTHKEIGQMMNISDNTSKTQLLRAKKILKEKVELMMVEKVKVPFSDFKVLRNDQSQISCELLQAV